MNHFDIITETLNSIDPGQPNVIVKLSNPTNLRIVENRWSANIDANSFHSSLIKESCRRRMVTHGPEKGYVIDIESTITIIKDNVLSTIMKIYSESCPSKEPRRTKLYKKILYLVRTAGRLDKTDLLNFMFDIAQYNYSVTTEVSLRNSANDVHRKNIYKLFEIMESKHGSKESSNR